MLPRLLSAVFAALLLAACTNIGPQTVPRDRFDYNAAISDSWKEQTLLNIVKLRYADMPLFVEVASVVSGYTLEGAVNLGATASSQNAVQGDFLALGGSGKYTDRPTITYAPITGSQFNQSFMSPIPPGAVLFLMQSGWPVDLIFPLTVDSINGLRSRSSAGANQRAGDPEFYRVIELLRRFQVAGVSGMRVKKGQDESETIVLFFHKKNLSPELREAQLELDRLLGLRTNADEVTVTYSFLAGSDDELAMITRSMLHIMVDLASQIEVPPEDIDEGRTIAALVPPSEGPMALSRLIEIRHGSEPPADAFTAVRYRDLWFWIDDRDFKSKKTFAFLMILFSMTETGGKEGLPLVTIPAG